MTGWCVTTRTGPNDTTFWLGVADKPELIGITILPSPETSHPSQRAQACADALNLFDAAIELPQPAQRTMNLLNDENRPT